MFNLSQLYRPITANPSRTNEFMPCKALQPYIRCFWGSGSPRLYLEEIQFQAEQHLPVDLGVEVIIPDTCMDIIWEQKNTMGNSRTYFCGINDAPFEVPREPYRDGESYFAIRFHFWAVHYFSDHHLRDVLNANVDVEQYFSTFRKELGGLLQETTSMPERIAVAETYLLRRLEHFSGTHNSLMNAVHMIIKHKGVVTAEELEFNTSVSRRQLERLFQEYIGVAPKKVANLVRFQNTWQDLYYNTRINRSVQDIVFDYGYSHQSHFINSFKKYAGKTPLEALACSGR